MTNAYEHNERGHDAGDCCEDDSAAKEISAKELSEQYRATLLDQGEVLIGTVTWTRNDVIDHDLDHITELQFRLNLATAGTLAFSVAAKALQAAQEKALQEVFSGQARRQVGLS